MPITLTFTDSPNDPDSCRAIYRLSGFDPDTTYTLGLGGGESGEGTGTFLEEVSITTDSSGRAYYESSLDIPAGTWAIASIGTTNSGWIFVQC
jgi:hypothetical protein